MFSWVQRKVRGKQETTKTSTGSITSFIRPSTCGEEFSDWPNELLAIGTFGNTNTPKQCDLSTFQHTPSAVITQTENDDIVEESSGESNIDEFSTCLENLQDHNFAKNDCRRLERSMSLVELRGQNNISLETNNNNSSIQKKSISYLFKKAFACSGGFGPKPTVFIDPLFPRDSLFHETKFETSRLEKIFRAILHKKVYPQGSSPRAALKKYLDSKDKKETESDDESDDGGKWVKTDSEYIVLEI